MLVAIVIAFGRGPNQGQSNTYHIMLTSQLLVQESSMAHASLSIDASLVDLTCPLFFLHGMRTYKKTKH